MSENNPYMNDNNGNQYNNQNFQQQPTNYPYQPAQPQNGQVEQGYNPYPPVQGQEFQAQYQQQMPMQGYQQDANQYQPAQQNTYAGQQYGQTNYQQYEQNQAYQPEQQFPTAKAVNASEQFSNDNLPYQPANSQQTSNLVSNDGMPEVIINPPLETIKEDLLSSVTPTVEENLNLDGHQVFVRQPVIQDREGYDDIRVEEPSNNSTIFSTPTPIYDPNATDTQSQPQEPAITPQSQVEKEEPKPKAPAPDFLTSMRSFYSALGDTKAEASEEVSAPNVTNEPLPEFTNNIDIFTEQSKEVTSPVQQAPQTEKPQEFNPAQFNQLDGSKKNNQVSANETAQEVDQSFLMQMIGKQDQPKVQPNIEEEVAQQVPVVQEPQAVVPPMPKPINAPRQQVVQEPVLEAQQQVPIAQKQSPIVQQQVKETVAQVDEPMVGQNVQTITQERPAEQQINPTTASSNDIKIEKPQPVTVKSKDYIQEQSPEEKDDQYWNYMNSLLDKFDDGEVHNENFAPIEPEIDLQNEPDEQDEVILENFGKSIDKSADDSVLTKAQSVFKKATQELVEEPTDFEKNFNSGFGVEIEEKEPKKKEKKLKKKKMSKPKKETEQKKVSINGKSESPLLLSENKGGKKKGLIILGIILAVLLLLTCVGAFFGKKMINRSKNKKYEKYISSALEVKTSWANVRSRYPNVTFPSGMQKEMADVYAINPDFVGWIKIDGLDISLPVVQNQEYTYYLKHNFEKKKSSYGTTFMQYGNNIENLDMNTVIYGKTMKTDSQMFTKLKEYKDIENYKKAPVIEFNTLYKNYKWKIFAVFITNSKPEQDNGYVFNFTFTDLPWNDEEQYVEMFSNYISKTKERSLYNTGVDVLPTDRLLTLTTTSNEFKGARIVVLARMVRDGENEEVPLSLVKENKNPRYPQAWYDKNNQKNSHDKDTWDPESMPS